MKKIFVFSMEKIPEDGQLPVVHEIPKCALGEAETSPEKRKGRVLLVLNTPICENFNVLWESGKNKINNILLA